MFGGVLALFVFAIMVMNIKEEFRHKKFVKFAGAGLINRFFIFYWYIPVYLKETRTPQEDSSTRGCKLDWQATLFLLSFAI